MAKPLPGRGPITKGVDTRGEERPKWLPPKWLPYSMQVAVYPADSETGRESIKSVEEIYRRYAGALSREMETLEFTSGSISGYVKALRQRGSRVFLMVAGPEIGEKVGLDSIPSYDEYDKLVEGLKQPLPDKPVHAYTLRLAYATDEEQANVLLHAYLKNAGRSLGSAGIIGDCLLAMLIRPGDDSPQTRSRELLAIPHGHDLQTTAGIVWALCSDICSLAVCTEEMNRLYADRKLMLDQLDASEATTQLRINEIRSVMRRPVDETRPGDLEEILKEITIQFSRLSALAGSMRRDHVKARGLLRDLKHLLKTWNEKPVGGNRTNASAMVDDFEDLMAPFVDFAERTEALMTQLNTVLDSVRTYLGIQQQKISIAQQTSSKEQLVRLVNLQEILHKMEVLIVAFYLTAMASIVFQALAYQSANLLTAVFIPIALLISVFMGRLLHKKD